MPLPLLRELGRASAARLVGAAGVAPAPAAWALAHQRQQAGLASAAEPAPAATKAHGKP